MNIFNRHMFSCLVLNTFGNITPSIVINIFLVVSNQYEIICLYNEFG